MYIHVCIHVSVYIVKLNHVYATLPNFLCPSVVDVGFVQSVYTASERDMSAIACVEVRRGLLGISLDFSLTSHSGSAQGTHTKCHTDYFIMVSILVPLVTCMARTGKQLVRD